MQTGRFRALELQKKKLEEDLDEAEREQKMMKLICDNYEKQIAKRKAAMNKQLKSPSPTKNASPTKFTLLQNTSPCKMNNPEVYETIDLKKTLATC